MKKENKMRGRFAVLQLGNQFCRQGLLDVLMKVVKRQRAYCTYATLHALFRFSCQKLYTFLLSPLVAWPLKSHFGFSKYEQHLQIQFICLQPQQQLSLSLCVYVCVCVIYNPKCMLCTHACMCMGKLLNLYTKAAQLQLPK